MSKSKKRATPTDPGLYEKVKREAKKRFKAWPSAYASGWLVKEYKRRGGKYKGGRKNKEDNPLSRWYKEKWETAPPQSKPCGRKRATRDLKNYPVCRPTVRVSKRTPKTWKEMSPRELNEWKKGKMRRGPNWT